MSQSSWNGGLPEPPGIVYANEGASAPAASVPGAPVPPSEETVATGAWKAPRRPAVVFGAEDAKALAAAGAIGLLWCLASDYALFSLPFVFGGGIGLTLAMLAFVAAIVVCARRRGRLDFGTIALAVVVSALACVPTITTFLWLRMTNALVLTVAVIALYGRASGLGRGAVLTISTLWSSLGAFVTSLFRNWPLPFALAGRSGKGRSQVALPVLCGLAIALMVMWVVVPLLGSADMVFDDILSGMARDLLHIDVETAAWRIVRAVVIIPVAFSLLYAVIHGDACTSGKPDSSVTSPCSDATSLASVTALVALDVVYAAFAVVQFKYLFGGETASAMNGGYAEYARSGFFQLVTVAMINLALMAVAMRIERGRRRSATSRVMRLSLVALTGVMVASAAWRMHLYVGEYGLSFLRALTYLGMGFIAACLVILVVKEFLPKTPAFHAAFCAGMAMWLAFALCGADARIAEYNVNGYLSGDIEQVDVGYMREFSADVVPSLDRLKEERPRFAEEVDETEQAMRSDSYDRTWSEWGLPDLRARVIPSSSTAWWPKTYPELKSVHDA